MVFFAKQMETKRQVSQALHQHQSLSIASPLISCKVVFCDHQKKLPICIALFQEFKNWPIQPDSKKLQMLFEVQHQTYLDYTCAGYLVPNIVDWSPWNVLEQHIRIIAV